MSVKNGFASCRDLLILLLLWCGAVALANPAGDFPLNDDWAYGLNTRALAVENRLFFSEWPAMTLIAHTLWGALFCKFFGFSFTALRFSTLLTGLIGLAGFYRLLTWATLPRQMVWFLSLLLVFNPFWFVLANSYMTDVPFLAVLLWSVYFFLKMLEKPAVTVLLCATFFAIWACFIRQLGLIVPGIFMLLFLYYQPFTRKNLLFAMLPVALCFSGVELFTAWQKSTGQLPPAYTGLHHLWTAFANNPEALNIAATRIGIALMTMGLFLLPVFPRYHFKNPFKNRLAWLLLPLGGCCIWIAWSDFPNGNVFYNLGLGPKLLKDAYWGEHTGPKLSEAGFLVVKWVATIGACILLLAAGEKSAVSKRQALLRHFSIGVVLAYLGFVCANSLLIDRYLFPFTPFLLLLYGTACKRFTKPGWLLLGLLCLFSVTATHDYLAWNRARWAAAAQLATQDIPPAQIDGGFEFNGWYATGPVSQKVPGLKSWWFVRDDEWVISFGPVYGYDPAFTTPFRRWLPPGDDSILVSRRKAYAEHDSLLCDMEHLTPDGAAFEPAGSGPNPGNGETRSAEKAHSGQYSLRLNSAAPFGATMPLDTFQAFDRLIIGVWRYPANADAGIVVTAADAGKAYFFEPANVVEQDSAGWGLLLMSVTIPQSAIGSKGRFYLWNPSREQTVWFDDLRIRRLRMK